MNIRPLAKVDYVEWRKLWIAYLDFYETSLSAEVIEETFSKLIDNDQRRQNAFVAEDDDKLVGLVHYIFHPHNWKIENVLLLARSLCRTAKPGEKNRSAVN